MAEKKGKKKIKHQDLKPKENVKGGKLPPGSPGANSPKPLGPHGPYGPHGPLGPH